MPTGSCGWRRAPPDRRMMEPVRLARLVHALPRGADIKAMVVGCGSGYSAAILSRLAGSVVAVEEDKALAALARENLAAVGAAMSPWSRQSSPRGIRRAVPTTPS